MHETTKYEVSLVMNYDISNYIMNLKECVNTVMYLFELLCRHRTDSMKKKIFASVHQ